MRSPSSDTVAVRLLRIGTCLCFAGWAWTYLYWQGPISGLLWNEATFELASRLGFDWDEFVGTGANDGFVQRIVKYSGWFLLLNAFLALMVSTKARTLILMMVFGGMLLLVQSYAKYVEVGFQLPMLFEYACQFLIPLLLVQSLTFGVRSRVTTGTAVLACVATFAGHGVYALGLWPTPGSFFGMTSILLNVDYHSARMFLRIAGAIDLLVCLCLLVPVVRRPAALYAAFWGFMTAVARPAAGMSFGLRYWGADQYVHEAILRTPHFLIPLFLYVAWQSSEIRVIESTSSRELSEAKDQA